MKLNERFDYNYNDFYNDIIAISTAIKNYINDGLTMLDEFVNELNDANSYADSMNDNIYCGFIMDFLNRNYEPFIIEKINDKRNKLLQLMNVDKFDIDNEISRYNRLLNEWNDFVSFVKNENLLNLNEFDYNQIHGVQVYFSPTCSANRKNEINDFINTLYKHFPNVLLRLDTICCVTKDYIDLVCDDSNTIAYFVEDAIFISENETKNKLDIFAPYHEFGHFIYSQLSNKSKIYWNLKTRDWYNKKIKFTRDNNNNSQLDIDNINNCNWIWPEELFADCIGLKLCNVHMNDEDYVHKCDLEITKEFEFILSQEFN